jgi:hypothetical protein
MRPMSRGALEFLFSKEKLEIMKYQKPVVVAVAAVEAIQGTNGAGKAGVFIETLDPNLPPSIGAYEADE